MRILLIAALCLGLFAAVMDYFYKARCVRGASASLIHLCVYHGYVPK